MNTDIMLNYLLINQKSISKELCIDIIHAFENESIKYEGKTSGGVNKNVKDTLDFSIPLNTNIKNEKWSKIRSLLDKELQYNIKKYVNKLDSFMENKEELTKYQTFSSNNVSFEVMQIQKYAKLQGKYINHQDSNIEWTNKKHRVVTYLWYLNDIEEGGETEFWSSYRIKPEAGKLVFFPATWTYPHRGMIPISHDKYIITGWIYVDN